MSNKVCAFEAGNDHDEDAKKQDVRGAGTSQTSEKQDTPSKESKSDATPSKKEEQYTPEKLEAARKRIRLTEAWIPENPPAYRFMRDEARDTAKQGRRVSGSALVEDMRRKDFVNQHGKPTKVSNSLAAVLVRFIAKEDPIVRRHIVRRTDIYEEVGY